MIEPISRRDAAGFSLLEVLVAFVILTLSITVLLQAFGTSTRNSRRAHDHLQAIGLAESMMARINHDLALQEGRLEGEFDDRYGWFQTVTEISIEVQTEADSDLSKDQGTDQEEAEIDTGEEPGADEEVRQSDESPDPELAAEAEESSTQAALSSVRVYRVDLTVVWGPTGQYSVSLTSLRMAGTEDPGA